jgi:peptide/nickel transport system substrate-binding protein
VRSRALIAALLAAATLFAAACGSDDAGPPQTGGTIIDAEDQSPPILNVLLADGATVTAQRIVSNVLQNLLTADQTGAYTPQLAERVPSGDDLREGPLRVTFHLRPGARWSDGPAVTSADVVFTWRTMMDPDNQVASRAGWDQIAAIRPGRTAAGGTCPAATCFTVVFRGDYAPWRDVFSVSGGYYVLPRHVLLGEDFNTVWNRGGIVGSGPFTLESFTPAVRAVLQRDPDYWGAGLANGGPFLDTLVVNFLDSPGAAITALRQGEAQMTSPPPDPELIARAAAIEGVEVQSVPSLFFEHVILNTAAAPLDDERVRQALAYAIDREQIVDVLLDGSVPVLQSVVRPAQLGYAPAFEMYAHDPGRAAALLEEAGWTRGEDGIFEKDGKALEVPVAYSSESELRRTTARLMVQQAQEAGIRLVPTPMSSDRLYGSVLNQGDFTAAMAAFGGGGDPSLTGLLASDQIPTKENAFLGQNVYRWSDPEADSLMRRSDHEVVDAERVATLGEVQGIVAREVPLIPLYAQPNTVAYVSDLEGVEVNPTQAEVFWNSAEWSLAR